MFGRSESQHTAMSRLHAFLTSMQELRSLQAAEEAALSRPVGPSGLWPTADGVMAAGATQRGKPSHGVPIGGTLAWIDPSLPPEAEQFDALDCVRNLRERQQQQAADALLGDAHLRMLHDRLQAQKLQVTLEGIHKSRHATFRLGNEYMRQAVRQNNVAATGTKPRPTATSSLGYGKQFEPCMNYPAESLLSPAGLSKTSTSCESNHMVGNSQSLLGAGNVGAQEVIARCVEEFGRREDATVDMSQYLLAWQSYTTWASGMYDHGRGFEVPCLGRVVVKNQRVGAAQEPHVTSDHISRNQVAGFFGSHRMLGRHGLTQHLAPMFDVDFSAAYHRATRVNYSILSRSCGLHVDDITRRLKEFVWCLLQMAGEHPEKDLQIDLGPGVLSCKRRRLSVEFHRSPGLDAYSMSGQSPPTSPPRTPRGDRSPSVNSMVSDASSWTVQSIGSSVAANGRWARWPLPHTSERSGSSVVRCESRASTDSGLYSTASSLADDSAESIQEDSLSNTQKATDAKYDSAHVAQLSAANTALGTENAMLRAKLDRLLHFTTTELQYSGGVDMTAARAKPMQPLSPPPPKRERPPTARSRTLAVPVAPPVRHCGGNDLLGSSYPTW